MAAQEYIYSLASKGRYIFTLGQMVSALRSSEQAARLALNRLSKKKVVASPAQGVYLILPYEYQSLGCLPPEQFIPELMRIWGKSYYIGLLSAAQFHGAAHHRPQTFQVVTNFQRKPIECGKVRVDFMFRKNVTEIPTESIKTPRGPALLSTPEATAFDLIGYEKRCGGLENVATIIEELSEKLSPQKLVQVAQFSPIAWAQRLGFILELVGRSDTSEMLKRYVSKRNPVVSKLSSQSSSQNASRSSQWRLLVNTQLEPDL